MNTGTNKAIVAFLFLFLLLLGFPPGSQAQEGEALVLASQIIDQDVYDENQKLIGEVDDMIIRRSGKVKKITVEFGGFLDIADKLVAIAFKNTSMKNGGIALEATEEDLEKWQEFNYYESNLRPEYYYRPRSRAYGGRYYGGPYGSPYGRPYPYSYRGRYGYRPGYSYPGAQEMPYEFALSPSRFLASVVMDRRLINEEGKDIGSVEDLIINRKNNDVEKIVLSSLDIMGEDVYVALPYEPMGFTAYGLVYDITPKELKDFIYPYKE